MKRVVIKIEKVKGTRGYRYTLACNQCRKELKIRGSSYKKGKGLFCSKRCRSKNKKWREKLSQSLKDGFKKGRIHPRGMLGKIAWNKGKKNPRWKRENNPNWNNGSTFEEYGDGFTRKLKEKIVDRDNHRCRECGANNCKLVVHHIDYDKKNNKTENLITLCRSCHSKTNFNRKDWENYFKALNLNYDICRPSAIDKTDEAGDKKPLR